MGTVCRSFITATATLILILIATHLQEVKSSGIFDLNLISFENREGRDNRGGCCSGRLDADGLCPPCPVYLRICIKHYQAIVDLNSPCIFHEFVTELLEESNATEQKGLQVLSKDSTMTFDFDFGWPGEFTMIIEAWHPSDRIGHKVLVARFTAQKTLMVGQEWTQANLTTTTNNSSLRIMYRVYCPVNYYGPTCDILCKSRDDKFGHYTCKNDGTILCKPGWNGTYCDRAVCLAGCHHEHGMCNLPNECNCRHGWEGELCDKCKRYPGCMHGTCTLPFQCHCDEGWGGLFCDQDLNYCTNHKPCQNGGTCTNTGQGSYTCSCTSEFMGKDCDVPKNPCQKNPCKNNGFCQNPSEGEYSCECPPGFFGPRCETSATICKNNPCENGGSCIYKHNDFMCDCPPEFSGFFCEKKVTTSCTQSYCLNGGTCEELSTGPHCHCPRDVSGKHCEIIVNCSLTACENGGTCYQHPSTGQFLCLCPPGFTSSYCEIQIQKCASNSCANGGICRDLSDGYYCDCKSGFGGKDCSTRHTFCSSSPCLNGAFCQDTLTGFLCQCVGGYHGIRCQHKGNNSRDFKRQYNASNVSQRVSSEEKEAQPLSGKQVALIASLSSVLIIFVILLCCVLFCTLRRRKEKLSSKEPSSKAKECDFDVVDEQLQNERNMMHMNNKQHTMPQKIVNTLDRLPAKVSNEAPPKVLNIEVSNKKVLDKSLVCTQRTLQKKENTCGGSLSHITQDWPSSNSAGIYVIEDHYQSCPEAGSTLELENILATEV